MKHHLIMKTTVTFAKRLPASRSCATGTGKPITNLRAASVRTQPFHSLQAEADAICAKVEVWRMLVRRPMGKASYRRYIDMIADGLKTAANLRSYSQPQ